MFPLSTVLFPHATLPLHVFEPRYRIMTEECLEGDGRFGVVLISRGSEVGGGETRVAVGTEARIEQATSTPDGRSMLLVRGRARFRVSAWLPDHPYPRGAVEWLAEPAGETGGPDRLAQASAAVRRARALLSELRDVPGLGPEPDGDADARSWWLCDQAPVTTLDRQRLLECDDLDHRLALLAELVGSVGADLERMLAGG